MSTTPSSPLTNATIYIAGHRGLVGSAICRALEQQGSSKILTRTHAELDLTDQAAVRIFFDKHRPDYVFLSAAKVGGIHANDTYPADFIRDNLLIQTNIIDSAYQCGSKKLLFLGSSCIYPKFAPQPMQEDHLLTGELEPTNEWYAIAKIAGIKMCQAYHRQHGFNAISLMPTNLYGPGDNFDLKNSHVLPALIRKFHEAKLQDLPEVEVWGTGTPKREFLHVDDLAAACIFLMKNYDDPAIVNVGSGEEVSIAELAQLVAQAVGYEGTVRYNTDMPDGTPRKFLDVSRLSSLGWTSQISLPTGIADTYAWFLANEGALRK
ncbi:MAG: GDP-L-fucose synthase [Candidatus Electrothrix aestuarii]|uniref:GDP-L-fucose synthase n=1 Tax=Candidatus Electrothrix aestuarii TaxID=3062594 RepID=A0AAU8LPS8_9BACT|nr:GDP-L-fucose synthase [Candidatus Electrothrix aestuarii]